MSETGQIQIDSDFGRAIASIASKDDVVNIVEIGTWNGLGSTICVLESIKNKNSNFISIELIKEMYDKAKSNLKNYKTKVKLLNGAIINENDLGWFNIQEAKNSFTDIEKEHFNLYYQKEIDAIKHACNVLHELPETIDFLILDGGEYSTYPEWMLLKNRTKILAIDDTNILKGKKIIQDLDSDKEWECIWGYDKNYRNGCSIWRKRNV